MMDKPVFIFIVDKTDRRLGAADKGATKASDEWLCKQIVSNKASNSDNLIVLNVITTSQKHVSSSKQVQQEDRYRRQRR